MASLVQEESGLGVPAVAKLKEYHIMCAEELARNQSVRKIASTFDVDESTLRYRLGRKRTGAVDGRAQQPEACAPYETLISEWMRDQESQKRPEPVQALYERLCAEHGYTGSYMSVYRFVTRRRKTPLPAPFRRVETRPGAQTQVDWLQRRVYVRSLGGFTKLSAFVMTLSHSRMWVVIWSRSENMLAWLDGHNRAFEFLGGVPSFVRLDNLKTGVASGCGAWAKLNDGYETYAKQMEFTPDPHRVNTLRDKGKAERRVDDVKVLQVTDKDRFEDVDDLQETGTLRVVDRSKKLTCPVTGKSVYESWHLEKPYLKPLPLSLPEPFDVQVLREVSRDCLVAFEGRRYSVPYRWAKRTVQVRGCAATVEIWGEGKRLCVFPRKTDCRLLVDQNHYEATGEDKAHAPVPLGKIGRQIVVPRSWEIEDAPRRSIDRYEEIVGTTRKGAVS
jgi:transposase